MDLKYLECILGYGKTRCIVDVVIIVNSAKGIIYVYRHTRLLLIVVSAVVAHQLVMQHKRRPLSGFGATGTVTTIELYIEERTRPYNRPWKGPMAL